MSSIICKLCGREVKEDNLKHWYTEHKIKMANYFIKHHPKFDKLTNELLPFKDIDSYLLTDFITKINRNKWLKSQTLENRQNYLKQLLINRYNFKNWRFIPTQVELRSCPELVGIKTFNDNFPQNYYKLCEELGYKSRGFYNINEKTILKSARSLRGNPVLVDSREQKMINLGNKEIKISTLLYGDYCLEKDNYGIYFERKELGDFINSMSQGFDRIKKEIERAQKNGDYIIMLVEDTITNAMSFEYLPHISKKIQATGSFIFHRAREVIQEFDNFQILFCKGRMDLVEKMRFIMEYGQNAKNLDWQLANDIGLINNGI